MEGKPRKARRWSPAIVAGVLALIGACGVCCLLSALVIRRSSRSQIPGGLSVHVCAGVSTRPRIQAGVAWYAPISSYRGPLAWSPYAICADIPVSRAPQRLHREWMFPP
jgi:hypothetical protein